MTGDPVRWGIIGAGRIAHLFASDLLLCRSDARLVAVASRSRDRAERFARRFGGRPLEGYDGLLSDPQVDVVYVATPHATHHTLSLRAIAAGKAVLCEKPLTIDATQAAELAAAARARSTFLLEGMWSRFFPAVARLEAHIADGAIGEVRAVQASFGFRAPNDPHDRLLYRALGGGSLLDVGVYPIALATALLGVPSEIRALAHLGETGVDEQAALLLSYPSGALATLASAVRTELPRDALVIGTKGYIRLGSPFWRPTELTLVLTHDPDAPPVASGWRGRAIGAGRRVQRAFAAAGPLGVHLERAARTIGQRLLGPGRGRRERFPYRGHGFHYEIREVGRCLSAGLTESPRWPLASTLEVMRTLDAARAAIGLAYPEE